MKKIILIASFFSLIGGLSAQTSQSSNVKKTPPPTSKVGKTLPADFPKYLDTGNPEADMLSYKAKKEQWISENPEKYKAMINSSGANNSGQRTQSVTTSK